jgi:hypothetical protein
MTKKARGKILNPPPHLATKAQRHKETQKILFLSPLVSLCLGGKEKVRTVAPKSFKIRISEKKQRGFTKGDIFGKIY